MKTIAKIAKAEIDIKKSQFICRLFPIKNSTEAKKIIEEIAIKYSDATHNCSAYISSDGEAYDDDGEPRGTAGRPMINVLKKNNLENILAIVTRYFGGIKLGAGGLVRAYSKSVIEAIEISDIVEMELYNTYEIIFDYSNIKEIDNEIRTKNINVTEKSFEKYVIYKIAILNEIGSNKNLVKSFKEKLGSKIQCKYLKKEYLSIFIYFLNL